jgi:GntR family transcriptional regulator / MocR family aminotransferase
MPIDWATFGVDLHLDPSNAGGRRLGVERALREAVRDGRLAPGTRLPSTRALAAHLGIARGTVASAYDQLVAEGFLTARTGSGTVVAPVRLDPAQVTASAPVSLPRFDLRPGSPDVSTFPAAVWLRSLRRALASAPVASYNYGDPRGSVILRAALASYLGRTRGVLASPDQIVITSGYVQALSLLARVLGGTFGMEDPGFPFHREVVRQAGARVRTLRVDSHGASFSDLFHATAAVVTPAHQYPTGVTLHPSRRQAAVAWARRTGGLIVEDDYDGEFRYDRQPVGALQGIAPSHVAYVGTASKTLGPALRLGWLVVPPHLLDAVVEAKRHADMHTETLGQLALADMVTTHAYDRHVRACRLRYRRRRDLLLERLGPRWPVSGIAAGLHVMLALESEGVEREVVDRAATAGLAVGDLGSHWDSTPRNRPGGLIVGYANPGEGAYAAALDALAHVLHAFP